MTKVICRPGLVAAALLVVACDDGADRAPAARPASTAPPASAPPPVTEAAAPIRAAAPASIPTWATHRGEVVVAREWTDGLGQNLLLLTRTAPTPATACGDEECIGNDRETYGYHWVTDGSGPAALLWRTTDFVRNCELDLTLDVSERTVSITDLDHDGVAESTFMYTLACRGGLDPAALKLIMHEGPTKYAIRGTTDLTAEIGAEYGRSRMTLDPAFDTAPPEFKDFAVAHWTRFVREDWQTGAAP